LSKIGSNASLKKYIVSRLSEDKWSPEMISGRMKLEKQSICISHEAIYQYIYSYPGQKLKLYEHLMYARPKRQQKYTRRHRYKVADEFLLKNRPETINDRSEFGHYEGDLTFFKGNSSGNISVLVERKSKKAFLIRNDNKTTDLVIPNIISKIKSTGSTVKSITFDNGSEFSRFKDLEKATNSQVYFADPRSPWQRGLNENTNGLLRRYFPKGCNFHTIDDSVIANVVEKLNSRPRKCLNFRTPYEVLFKTKTVALAT